MNRKYKAFPHYRKVVALLWSENDPARERILAEFDEEDRVHALEVSADRDARSVVRKAMRTDADS